MKIGIFDSGVGGLQVLSAITKLIPQYDYIYYGDTINMPYGSRSQEDIFNLSQKAIEFLFSHDAQIIIIACNTVSTNALRRLQKDYLPKNYPSRRILGVIVPTIEAIITENTKHAGLIATPSTVASAIYPKQLHMANSNIKITQVASPGLALNIEQNNILGAGIILKDAVQFLTSLGVDTIVLGCTHYGIMTDFIKSIAPDTTIINQNEIIPGKLSQYVRRHPEIEQSLSKNSNRELFVTKLTPKIQTTAREWFGDNTIKSIV